MGKALAVTEEWVLKSKKRMSRIVIGSTIRVIDAANVPTAKGGNMRVKTGFLRASGQVSFNGMPTGPGRGSDDKTYPYDAKPYELELAKLTLGQRIYFGWTANYARARENKDAFLRMAVQRWQEFVNSETAKAKTESAANTARRDAGK